MELRKRIPHRNSSDKDEDKQQEYCSEFLGNGERSSSKGQVNNSPTTRTDGEDTEKLQHDKGVSFTGKVKSFLQKACTFILVILILTTITAGMLWQFSPMAKEAMQLRLMRFFRDVSRARARSNLMGGSSLAIVMPVLMGTEESLLPWVDEEDGEMGDGGIWLTPEELKQYDGSNPELPLLYISIKGRIYDVTEGKEFYGAGRSYHHFVGRDATRAYATGCNKEECLVSSLIGLDPIWLAEINRWVELYEYHDKYKYVGKLRADPVDAELEKEMMEKQLENDKLRQNLTVADMIFKGKHAYAVEDDGENAKAYWNAAMVRLGEASPNDSLQTVKYRAELLNLQASLAQKLQLYGAAVEHYDEALAGLKQALGEKAFHENVLVATALSDKAAAQFTLGKTELAIQNLQASIQVYTQSLHIHKNTIGGEEMETQLPTEDVSKEEDEKSEKEKPFDYDNVFAQLVNTKWNLAKALASLERQMDALETLKAIVSNAEEYKNALATSTQSRAPFNIKSTQMWQKITAGAQQGIEMVEKDLQRQRSDSERNE